MKPPVSIRHISVKFKHFQWKNLIWKCRLQNCVHFFSASIYQYNTRGLGQIFHSKEGNTNSAIKLCIRKQDFLKCFLALGMMDLSHKFHSALFQYSTMHHSVTKWYIVMFVWCIVRSVRWVYSIITFIITMSFIILQYTHLLGRSLTVYNIVL